MSERPGQRRLTEAELRQLYNSATVRRQPENHPSVGNSDTQLGQEPSDFVDFSGAGFAPQTVPDTYEPFVNDDYRYGNGQPAFIDEAVEPVNYGETQASEVSQPVGGRSGVALLEKARSVLWTERSNRTRAFGAVFVGLALAGMTISNKSDNSGEPIAGVLGLADTNEMIFAEPDCLEPVIAGRVEQKASYVLNYRDVIINETELKKSQKSKSYKPKTINSFDHLEGAIKMQSDKKPATPFTKGEATTNRLPATLYDGEVNLGICNKTDMSEVVHVDGSSVEVDASKLVLTFDQSISENRQSTKAYEKFAPKAQGKANLGYITDRQYSYIRKKVVPNEKDPSLNNPKFDNSITASALSGLNDSNCLDQVQTASRNYFESFLRSQHPDEKFTVSWKGGGFTMPDKDYIKKASLEPNVRMTGQSTQCESFTYDGKEQSK